ncbi:MAG: phosphopantetheine-binding protein [Acidithiobacillus sp.]|nr:phosphopantetheine-binding protein [Acidithiobacillus sp.]
MLPSYKIRVYGLLEQEFGITPDRLKDYTTLDSLGLDSMDCTALVMALEAEFVMQVKDAEIHHLQTVGDVVRMVGDHLAGEAE